MPQVYGKISPGLSYLLIINDILVKVKKKHIIFRRNIDVSLWYQAKKTKSMHLFYTKETNVNTCYFALSKSEDNGLIASILFFP